MKHTIKWITKYIYTYFIITKPKSIVQQKMVLQIKGNKKTI